MREEPSNLTLLKNSLLCGFKGFFTFNLATFTWIIYSARTLSFSQDDREDLFHRYHKLKLNKEKAAYQIKKNIIPFFEVITVMPLIFIGAPYIPGFKKLFQIPLQMHLACLAICLVSMVIICFSLRLLKLREDCPCGSLERPLHTIEFRKPDNTRHQELKNLKFTVEAVDLNESSSPSNESISSLHLHEKMISEFNSLKFKGITLLTYLLDNMSVNEIKKTIQDTINLLEKEKYGSYKNNPYVIGLQEHISLKRAVKAITKINDDINSSPFNQNIEAFTTSFASRHNIDTKLAELLKTQIQNLQKQKYTDQEYANNLLKILYTTVITHELIKKCNKIEKAKCNPPKFCHKIKNAFLTLVLSPLILAQGVMMLALAVVSILETIITFLCETIKALFNTASFDGTKKEFKNTVEFLCSGLRHILTAIPVLGSLLTFEFTQVKKPSTPQQSQTQPLQTEYNFSTIMGWFDQIVNKILYPEKTAKTPNNILKNTTFLPNPRCKNSVCHNNNIK